MCAGPRAPAERSLSADHTGSQDPGEPEVDALRPALRPPAPRGSCLFRKHRAPWDQTAAPACEAGLQTPKDGETGPGDRLVSP